MKSRAGVCLVVCKTVAEGKGEKMKEEQTITEVKKATSFSFSERKRQSPGASDGCHLSFYQLLLTINTAAVEKCVFTGEERRDDGAGVGWCEL